MEITAHQEKIFSGRECFVSEAPKGVAIQSFVSHQCGATDFSTGLMTFEIGARLPYHLHEVSEAMTILEGTAAVMVDGRSYELSQLDCIHFPADAAHSIANHSTGVLRVHVAHGAARVEDRWLNGNLPKAGNERETIKRFTESSPYILSDGAEFCDLFARRYGSVGICGGYARFQPGSSLPCHFHEYDESISIVEGSATCLVQGTRYELSGCDTAYIPKHRPHRFLNQSREPMAMIWVYAGDEPERTIVDAGYCSGELVWPGRG